MDTIIKGKIKVHERLESHIKPGGTLQVRLLDPQIKRPFMFKIYKNARFPMDFELNESDIVSDERSEEVMNTNFYVDLIYRVDVEGKAMAFVGEAWGRAGKLYLLKKGAESNIIINGFINEKMLYGDIEKRKNDICAVWIDVRDELKKEITTNNQFHITIKTIGEQGQTFILAHKKIINMNIDDLPTDIHFTSEDFSYPIMRERKVFFELLVYSGGKIYFGGRASAKTMIDLQGFGLRLVLMRELPPDHPVLAEYEGILKPEQGAGNK